MKRTRIVPAVAALILTAAILHTRASADMHLRLIRAEPAADTTVTTAPTQIRLVFSEEPEIAITRITLTDAAQKVIPMGDPKADEKDTKIVALPITVPVTAGTYKVAWRTMAKDGHVVTGEFGFTFRPAQ